MHMCAFNYRFVPAVRLARQMIEAATSARSTTSAAATSRSGGRRRARRGGSTRPPPARARSATSARTSSTSRATSSARSRGRGRRPATFKPGRDRRRRLRGDRRVRGAAPSGRSRRPGSRPAARTRSAGRSTAPRARSRSTSSASTSCSERRRQGLPHDPRHQPDHPFWSGGGRPATSSAGSTHSSTRSQHLLDAIAGDSEVAPHGATFEDGYRAAEVCDAIVRAGETGTRQAVQYR